MQVANIPHANIQQAPASMESVVVRLLSFSALVSSNCPRTLRDLVRIYPAVEPGCDGEPPACAKFEMIDRGEREMWSVDALGQLEYLIDRAAIAALSGYVLIHSGVVAYGERAIMFPGAAGAGKSTLVAALCLNGFSYWSDEIAVLDRRSLVVHPFLKSIALKDGGWRTLVDLYGTSLSSVIAKRGNGNRIHFLAPPAAEISGSAARVQYIVVPIRQKGGAATLTQISSVQTFTELLQQSLNVPHHGPRGLEAIAQLAEEGRCYTLTYDELHDAVVAISTLVGR